MGVTVRGIQGTELAVKACRWGYTFFVVFFLNWLSTTHATDTLTVIAAGDVMLDSWIEQIIPDSGYDYPFRHLNDFLHSADLVFANLEAPFGTTGEPFEKEFAFQVHPDLVQVLLAGNINLVSLANNHTLDYGPACLKETLKILDQHHIRYSGAGVTLSDARKPALINVRGKRVALLAYNLTFPQEFWATDTTAGTCFPYDTFVFQDIARADREADIVLVSCHWGQELNQTPRPYQIDFAHRAIDAGADVVLGHHPHVIQGMEFYRGKLIAYSLGNFVFASYSEKAKESMLLKLTWGKDDSLGVYVLPINVYNRDVNFQPAPLEGEQREAFFRHLIKLSGELNSLPLVISSDGNVKRVKRS